MASLSSKLAGFTYTPNPQSPSKAGIIQAFAGAVAPQGWHLCDGTVLEQADYPQLFANIGSNWDAFAHPVDGTPTVGGSQFALPNLKGLYLAGVGNSGGDARSLGVFQSQKTAKNGLANSSSSISGTATTSGSSHSHGMTNSILRSSDIGVSGRYPQGGTSSSSTSFGDMSLSVNSSGSEHTHTLSGTADAQTIAGDNETRPSTAPVSYIIKLYDDEASVSMSLAQATSEKLGTVQLSSQFAAGDGAYGLSKKEELWGIGDIRHSILTEVQFQAINGTNWRLMDGQDVTGTAYATLTGNNNLPDAAGRFLRMTGGNAGALGVQQAQATARNGLGLTWSSANASTNSDSHTHTQQDYTVGGGGPVIGARGDIYAAGSLGSANTPTASDSHSHTLNKNQWNSNQVWAQDAETRPDNIAVNYFVKVD